MLFTFAAQSDTSLNGDCQLVSSITEKARLIKMFISCAFSLSKTSKFTYEFTNKLQLLRWVRPYQAFALEYFRLKRDILPRVDPVLIVQILNTPQSSPQSPWQNQFVYSTISFTVRNWCSYAQRRMNFGQRISCNIVCITLIAAIGND